MFVVRCLLLVIALLPWKLAAEEDVINGIYSGSMHLIDQSERDIPLQLALTLTGEYAIVDGVNRLVIDANVLIDDEGGPFGFSKVYYDQDANTIDLIYYRPQANSIPVSPGFQLKGHFENGFSTLKGFVYSSRSGRIGTFEVNRNNNRSMVMTRKYSGRWVGPITFEPENRQEMFEIAMVDSGIPTRSPADFEFEYSRGKAAYYSTHDIHQGIETTQIDYLRRRFFLQSRNSQTGELAISIEFTITPDGKTITGVMNSVFGGQRGSFVMNKVP